MSEESVNKNPAPQPETAKIVHTDRSIWRFLEVYARGRRFGSTVLDRYIFKEILIPFMMWLTFFTTLFMAIVLKDIIGELFGKGLGILNLLQYLSYLVGEQLTLTIPWACLLSGIMASGRLSGDSEIVAIRAAGISFPRMYAVFIFFGFLSMVVVGAMNLYIGPHNARAREDFEDRLKTYHSLSLVRAGRFLGRANFDGLSQKGSDIYAGAKQGRRLLQVQIREWFNFVTEDSERVSIKGKTIPIGDGFISQIVHAGSGELLTRRSPDGDLKKIIRLRNGFLIELDEKQKHYQVTNFFDGHMDYLIPPPAKSMGRLNVRPDNYTFWELLDFVDKMVNGGNTIDLCAMDPSCKSSGKNLQINQADGDGGGRVFKLPALSEMDFIIKQQQIWIMTNQGKVGQPGGPSPETMQQRMRIFLMLSAFMKDAEKTRRKFEVEIQSRIATPVACLLFFFISFPLGLTVKRSGKGMGFALAGGVFMVYNGLLSVGMSQAYAGKLHPAAGAWLPNLAIALIGVYVMSTRTDDFSPLKFLKKPVEYLVYPRKVIALFLYKQYRKYITPRLSPLIKRLGERIRPIREWLRDRVITPILAILPVEKFRSLRTFLGERIRRVYARSRDYVNRRLRRGDNS